MTLIAQHPTADSPICLGAALAFLQKGFAVIPVGRDKKPLIPSWKEYQERLPTGTEVTQWWTTTPEAGIALICGWKGLAILDIDDVKLAGCLTEDSVLQKGTPIVRSPSGGLHIYLQEQRQSHSGPLIDGVADIKAQGGYILVPPSTGYIRQNSVTAPLVVPNARAWAVELLGRYGHTSPVSSPATPVITLGRSIVEGARNNTLAKVAGSLRRQGLDEPVIAQALHAVNEKCCEKPLLEREVQSIAKSISRYPVPTNRYAGAHTEWCTPVIVCVADVQKEEVQWLWEHRIPRGKITLIDGDPSVGKSWLVLATASAVSRGFSLPSDGGPPERDPANVLFLTAEDGIGDTIRPRLESMEADLTRIRVLKAVKNQNGQERHLSLQDDLQIIEQELQSVPYALIVIDPLNAYLGMKVDTHKDADIRTVLTPIAQMAERHRVAILCVRHLTKSARDRAIYRGQGSIAYTAAARVVHLVGVNPQKPQERVIACIKNNLAPLPSAIAFEVSDGQFYWKGETDVTADMLLGPESSGEERSAIGEADTFLRVALFGGSKKAIDIKKEAKDAGIASQTLRRARSALGVTTKKVGGREGHWAWELPAQKVVPTGGTTWAPLKKTDVEATNGKGVHQEQWAPLKERHIEAEILKEITVQPPDQISV